MDLTRCDRCQSVFLEEMKRVPFTSIAVRWIASVAAGLMVVSGTAQETGILKTDKDRESYAIGVDMARNLKGRAIKVEAEPLLQGMRDVLSGGKLLMADEDLRKTLKTWQTDLKSNQLKGASAKPATIADENLAKGLAFLAQNKTNAGVVTLPSGLQYKVLKAGTGRKPTEADTVECHHRTRFIDGKEYSGTYLIGAPATLQVGQAVAAWKEALPLMSVGSKWRLFIPPQLAYGEKGVLDGRGRTRIGPNVTLICELELLGIK